MDQASGTPFDSIESAHEFISLLSQTIGEVKLDVQADVKREQKASTPRRLDALRMVVYTLEKLEHNMNRTQRALNDLRTLRRLLFEERAAARGKLSPGMAATKPLAAHKNLPAEHVMPAA